ncbi:MAG: cinnamyl-alcohol dehydrogenase-like protein [Monoraphidium minutum]|nr:MAG: cinnamyl-alcohol dehydrogenase-like protein [Monoraphidium minutum]
MPQKTATVTGATGYVAAELIRHLLGRGYAVKATARCDPSDARLAPLQRLADGAPGSLELIQVASLLARSPELDAALAGSEYVFHVASPFRFDGDPQKDIIEPAVEGTRVVLEAAAAASPRPARVVVTSSVCAIHDQHQRHPPAAGPGRKYSEADWNAFSTPDTEPYWVSKIEAERLAWRLGAELGLTVITVLPNFVLGPVVGPGAGGVSVGFMKDFLEAPDGKVPEGAWTVCDVRDVAAAHVAAAESPDAEGRYIVSQAGSFDARFVTDTLKASLPGAAGGLPDGARSETKETIDATKVQGQLGVELHPVAATLLDMARSLLEHGVAAPAWHKGGAAA